MKLSDYLLRSGKTCRQLAAEAGVSPAQISRLANGRRRPSLDLAERIHEATGGQVSLMDFVRNESFYPKEAA